MTRMIAISGTDAWRETHPRALIGILELSAVSNAKACAALDQRKRELEAALRERYQGFSRSDFVSAPVLSDYVRYYRSFEKTYHVLRESDCLMRLIKRRNHKVKRSSCSLTSYSGP